MDTRESILSDSFLDVPLIVDGFKLRPFTVGSLTLCRKMGLSLFLGKEGEAQGVKLEGDDRARQALAFAWAHSAPLREVVRAVREGTWSEEVDLFEFSISIESIPKILAEIRRLSEVSGEAAVDVAKRGGTSSGEKPPGN
jgi:hypothetical protein